MQSRTLANGTALVIGTAGPASVGVPRPALARFGRRSLKVSAQQALIVNAKGGGHAFIGLYLAKELQQAGHSVTIFNDGDKVRARSHQTDIVLTVLDDLLECDWFADEADGQRSIQSI